MIRRDLRGRDPHLNVRIGLFFAAALLLLIGEVTDRRAYAIPAALVAIAALLMRFFTGVDDDHGEADGDSAEHRTP